MSAKESKAVAWQTFRRQWAIDGMPKDKQRLAEAAWQSALHAAEAELGELRRRVLELADQWGRSWGDGYQTGIPKIDDATNNRTSAKAECATELRQLLATDGGADGEP